ncbi:unnamed protein product [Onchocerca flexuosa]|uniref:Phlebovirus glycoprotein G2 fusion domain-containing protein n=1 Tax=Onchocerca flexuosa TaxID=387005 RepID=A0A183I198_9BILA|nr:unnamed protein product [Onchocerca flexuosa]
MNGTKNNLTCTIYHTHPLKDPYCHLNTSSESERTIFQYYSCTCETNNIKARSKTIETPICVMALSISKLGLFYRLHTFHYSRFQFGNEIAPKRFSVSKAKSFSTYTALYNIDLIRHLLTYVVHIHSKTKVPRPYDRCTVFENRKRIERCSSSLGCYSFTRLDTREIMVSKGFTGCVDRIPALVKTLPNLSPLAWCLQMTYQENKYRCRAYKGTTNLTTSGTLCCCEEDCFITSVFLSTSFSDKKS